MILDRHILRQHSTLDPTQATCRITQIYVRPSLDVSFKSNTQEWFQHFLEKYHKTGLRYDQSSLSPDKLTLTIQIFWKNQEEWIKASRGDPIAIKNTEEALIYCAEHNIKQIRVREIKIDGVWFSSAKIQQDKDWAYLSLGGMLTDPALLANNATKRLITNE
jgi:hypothetical protein